MPQIVLPSGVLPTGLLYERHILFELIRTSTRANTAVRDRTGIPVFEAPEDKFELYWPGGHRWYLEFDVTGSREEWAWTGTATVYNMTPQHIRRIKELMDGMEFSEERLLLRIRAGWGPLTPPQIFMGEVVDFYTEWEENDLSCNFELVAGDSTWMLIQLEKFSWPTGVRKATVVYDLLNFWQARSGLGYVWVAPPGTYKSGKVFKTGDLLRDALEQIAQESDVNSHVFFSAYDSKLYFVPSDYDITGPVISWRNYLIGIPKEIRESSKSEQARELLPQNDQAKIEQQAAAPKTHEIISLLNPQMNPPYGFSVISRSFDELYREPKERYFRIKTVNHVADRQQYYSKVTAEETHKRSGRNR